MLTFSTKFEMLFLLFNSANGRYNVIATGIAPLAGHGGSFAHEYKIRNARKCLATQCGHSRIKRRGASKIWPSFV